ncbi:Zn-ribbon domain-containing OB-fold protein [Lacisediminihabitans sp. FW035]
MPDQYVPVATPETAPYWEAAARHELMLQRSRRTGEFFFYPRGAVPGSLDDEFEWALVSGRGTLVSYIINARPIPGTEGESPVIALVELEEGPRLMTNIVDVEPLPENLPIGAAVTVAFRQRGDMTLPVFALAGGAA